MATTMPSSPACAWWKRPQWRPCDRRQLHWCGHWVDCNKRERESVVKVVENAAQQMPSWPPGTCLSISRPAAARPINYSLSEIVCKVRSAIKIRGRIGTSQLLRQWRVWLAHWKAIYAHASFDFELESDADASTAAEWMIFARNKQRGVNVSVGSV